MKTSDHKALAEYLINSSNSKGLFEHKKAFLFGCIEPDLNPFTYLRGFMKYKSFKGHNTKNTKAYIEKYSNKIERYGLHSAFNYFILGTMIHYIADAFTYPHNDHFCGNLYNHAEYETLLHRIFKQSLENSRMHKHEMIFDIPEFLKKSHDAYKNNEPSFLNDFNYISSVCISVLQEVLEEKSVTVDFSSLIKLGVPYENSYYNRLL